MSANTDPASFSNESESAAQRAARLRRERRDAKIKAEGKSRLEQISNLSGRSNLASQHSQGAISNPEDSSTRPIGEPAVNGDPAEVDLSSYMTSRTGTLDKDDYKSGQSKNGRKHGDEEGASLAEDRMMALLQQMMTNTQPDQPQGAKGQDTYPPNGMPAMPDMASLFGALGGSSGLPSGQEAPFMQSRGREKSQDRHIRVWKSLHIMFSILIGIYAALASDVFPGSRIREANVKNLPESQNVSKQNPFWLFATIEVLLQSTRFLFERGRSIERSEGWMGFIVGFLPPPYQRYVSLCTRYANMLGIIIEDGLVVVFMLGLVTWWKGAAA